MKIFSIILLILLGGWGGAWADCYNSPALGDFYYTIMGAWDTSTPKYNKIAPSEKHKIACWVMRDTVNIVPAPNTEIWGCCSNTAKREAVGNDNDFYILTSQEWIEHFFCSNPLYDNQVDCEAQDCVLDPLTNYGSICTDRGTWNREEKWSD